METKDAQQTENLGQKLGKALRGGEVIELISDLGGGKTTLVRGLVAGTDSQDLVSSPTFTISNVYNAGKLTIHHFDFYRLVEAGLMEYELSDVIDEPDSVVIVEWSDVVAHVLPKERLSIRIASQPGEVDQDPDKEGRTIMLEYPEKLEYLVTDL